MDTRERFPSPDGSKARDDVLSGGILTARELRRDERPFPAFDSDVPLVLEPRPGERLDAIQRHIARNTDAMLELLYQHGSILLRGLPVTSTWDFEETLFSIGALRPMRGCFMAEAGRIHVNGSKRIFHTNSFVKTGGTIMLGGFHSESYYTSDIPSFITFCCLDEPWMGGETGTVHMERAYRELGDPLKAKLETEPSCSMVWPLAEVAATYGLDIETAGRFCREVGFDIVTMNGDENLVLYKPNVLVHPHTGRPSLHLHVSTEVRGVDDLLKRHLSEHCYTGPQWALHRAAWRRPGLMFGLNALFQIGRWVHKPKVLYELFQEQFVKQYQAMQRAAKVPVELRPPRAGRLLDDEEASSVAKAVLRHTNVFTWRRGDILILDNLQMLHSGMPGWGSRRIEVAMCNPVPIQWPLKSGVVRVEPDDSYASVFDRVTAQAGSVA